jgi:ATP-dependent DNA helicase RecQ
MENKETVLTKYFGYTAFRGGQSELIDALLAGRDALGIMPTGGGKSLCYQIPALMLDGLALVISPLISLMADQVMALRTAGVPAAYLNSTLSPGQMRQVYENLRSGQYKILYVAPERLLADGFLSAMQDLALSLVAVDEAHCISQWGQDFRPSYLKIVEFLEKLPRRPVVCAFTATATGQVRRDIERILELRDPLRVVTGFDRPNLYFQVLRPQQKLPQLHALLSQRRGASGIVYCSTRKEVEKVCDALCDQDVAATRYHAGLSDQERQRNQEDFLYDRKLIMVATNAFGMGIDKSNVSFVIHYNMPKSLEAYYQEAGRAGRDGQQADCILLFAPKDIYTAKFLIQSSSDQEELPQETRQAVMRQDLARLERMVGYCKTTDCLRGYLLDYFGQEHPARCQNCGNCQAELVTQDITRQAQMILSCVRRIQDRLGYCVGAALVIQVLRGSASQRVTQLGLHQLSTYGLMRDTPRDQVRAMVEHLESAGYLRTDPEHSALHLTAQAGEVLFRGKAVPMRVRKRPERSDDAPGGDLAGQASAVHPDDPLFLALKQVRYRLAREEGVPAFIIFSNATLVDMAHRRPRTMGEFLTVSGVGQTKAQRYAEPFLAAIRAFQDESAAHRK